VLSAKNPEDIGFAGGDSMLLSMSPLRAVVFHGHIASLNALSPILHRASQR
jgi:hypothetical protein